MNEILLINGSPRKKGNTSVLLAELARQLKEAGVSVKTVRLASLRVAPCNGCAWCQKGMKRHCVQKDDMGGLYHDLLACRGLVLASPVYWDGITAQLKAFIDRLFAMMKWRDGKAKSLLSGKRAGMVLVAGGGMGEGLSDSRKMLRTVIKWCGFKHIGQIIVPFVDKPGEVRAKQDAMKSVAVLARKFTK